MMPSFRTFGSVVSEEKMFEKVYRRQTTDDDRRQTTTDDGRKVIAIAHRPERSGELKKQEKVKRAIAPISLDTFSRNLAER